LEALLSGSADNRSGTSQIVREGTQPPGLDPAEVAGFVAFVPCPLAPMMAGLSLPLKQPTEVDAVVVEKADDRDSHGRARLSRGCGGDLRLF
jgi:hypothetical protein